MTFRPFVHPYVQPSFEHPPAIPALSRVEFCVNLAETWEVLEIVSSPRDVVLGRMCGVQAIDAIWRNLDGR